jgi:hypothetical protein
LAITDMKRNSVTTSFISTYSFNMRNNARIKVKRGIILIKKTSCASRSLKADLRARVLEIYPLSKTLVFKS